MTLHRNKLTQEELESQLDELIVERVAILSDDTQADEERHTQYCRVIITEFGDFKGLKAIQLYMIYNKLKRVELWLILLKQW